MKFMKNIYFDHSATTPVDKKVFQEMEPYFSEIYGNASSIHSFGQEAIRGVDVARERVAKFLNCKVSEVVFTSGATESDNLAIKGFVQAYRKLTKDPIHIITSIVEHDAILSPCAELASESVEITHLPVDKSGIVKIDAFEKALKDDTALVSIMYANSELGSIQPIRKIAKTIMKINEKRLRDWKKLRVSERGEKPKKIYFHTDATQAVNFCNCDVDWNYIDMLSMSAHKIYGPKGAGVFYKREGVPMESLQTGGHHEGDMRSGTLNVTGIVGLGSAIENIDSEKNNKKVAELRDMLVEEINKNIPDVVLNTDREVSTPSHAHYSFIGVEGEAILMSLDLEGIAVSTGSACASGSLKASHVLIAVGMKKEVAHNSIRFTLGKHNTKKDIERAMKVLPGIIKKLREMNPLYNKK
jgi:cysteine desulfurase